MTIAPDLIAIDDFFGAPAAAGARISPDGTRVGFLAPWKNRLNVWVQDVAANLSAETDARCVSADETRSVMHFRWTDDPRWLLYLQDTGGDENYHVFRVDLDDSRCPAVDLTPFSGRARSLSNRFGVRQAATRCCSTRGTPPSSTSTRSTSQRVGSN